MFAFRVAFLLLLLFSSGSCTFPNDSSGLEKRHSSQSDIEGKTTMWYSQLFHHQSNPQKDHKFHPNQGEEQGRIIGGSASATAAHKFFVRVDHMRQPYCGGTLFASDYVLTAAHCYTDKLSVVANGYTASSGYSFKGDQRYRTIEKVITHPSYNKDSYQNDIMILKLSSPVNDIPGLKPVGLNFDQSEPRNGADLMTMGLGMMANGQYSSVLQEVTVAAIDPNVCSAKYAKGGLNVPSEFMLCAGSSGKDSCSGDSGGPLVLRGTGEQVGIVSWGVGCANEDYPGVYTRVSTYEEWIKANVCSGVNKSIDPPDWCSGVPTEPSPVQNQCTDLVEPFRTKGISTCAEVQAKPFRDRRRICSRQLIVRNACKETCLQWYSCGTKKNWTWRRRAATSTRTQNSSERTYGMRSWRRDKNTTSNRRLRGSG